jgi:hypothetical protein
MKTDTAFLVSELSRVARCVDFRHERHLRINAQIAVENIALACILIKNSGTKAIGVAECLNTADVALDNLREDAETLDIKLRRPVTDNVDDAQDSVRCIVTLL